jgi:hypothetical protein
MPKNIVVLSDGTGHCYAPPRSVDRNRSPVAVSRKREYSGMRPETFGVFAVKVDKYGAWRPISNSQKPAVGAHFSDC